MLLSMAPEIESFILQRDRTLFSKLAHNFNDAITHLISQNEVAGISDTNLKTFQASYASTAFRCRFLQCLDSSIGFATEELRTKHEVGHCQLVYCPERNCQYHNIGLTKRSTLTAHIRKFHDPKSSLLIPPKVRGTHEESSSRAERKQQFLAHPTDSAVDNAIPELSTPEDIIVGTEVVYLNTNLR